MYTYKYGHRNCCPIDEGVWLDPEPSEVGSRRGQIQQVLAPQILFFQILSLSGWRSKLQIWPLFETGRR